MTETTQPRLPAADLPWSEILACERAVLRFTAAFDAADLGAMLTEFAPDGVWHRQDGVIRGHDGLRALMTARPPGLLVRHVITNMRVTPNGTDSAACESYITVYRHDNATTAPAPLNPPSLVGRYQDVLTRSGQAWLLRERRVIVDLKHIDGGK